MRKFSLSNITTVQWICLIVGVIILIWDFFQAPCPYVFGAQFDKAVLNSIDTEAISENYINFYHSFSEDNDECTVLFSKGEDIDPSFGCSILITISNVNKYSNKADVVYKEFIKNKSDGVYTNMTLIRKNNVEIFIMEDTTSLRSKGSQQALIEVLKKMQALDQ